MNAMGALGQRLLWRRSVKNSRRWVTPARKTSNPPKPMPLTISILEGAPDSMTKEEFRKRAGKDGKALPLSTMNLWMHGNPKKGIDGWLPYGTLGRFVRINKQDATEAIIKQSRGGRL